MLLACAMVMAALMSADQAGQTSEKGCDADVDAFLACNNPRVVRYLGSLSGEAVGRTLREVRLSDGRIAAKGYRFLGRARGVAKGSHVVLVQSSAQRRAFAWVEEGGTPLPLPTCAGAVPGSAYVLTGDVYTWAALQPGHGVVEVMCVDPSWHATMGGR